MLFLAASLSPDPRLQCAECSGLELIAVPVPGVPEWAWRSRLCTACVGGVVACQSCGAAAAEVVEPDGTAACLVCSMVGRAPASAVSAEVIPLRRAYARIYRESRPASGENGRRVRAAGSRT